MVISERFLNDSAQITCFYLKKIVFKILLSVRLQSEADTATLRTNNDRGTSVCIDTLLQTTRVLIENKYICGIRKHIRILAL